MAGPKSLKKLTRTLKSMKGPQYTRMDSGQKFTLKKPEKQFFRSPVALVNKDIFEERIIKWTLWRIKRTNLVNQEEEITYHLLIRTLWPQVNPLLKNRVQKLVKFMTLRRSINSLKRNSQSWRTITTILNNRLKWPQKTRKRWLNDSKDQLRHQSINQTQEVKVEQMSVNQETKWRKTQVHRSILLFTRKITQLIPKKVFELLKNRLFWLKVLKFLNESQVSHFRNEWKKI